MTADLRSIVQERYAGAARSAGTGSKGDCCGGSCGADPISGNLYSDADTSALPALAVAASLGCGNPTALAELRAGEVVLDLGSGGGIDVLLSARRVGPSGFAYGLDMTDAMLDLARRNQAEAGATNVEFLHGSIEAIPLPDESVDVIISNCVVNLSGDKRAVLREAHRVLRPGGRFAITDVVTRGELPAVVKDSMHLWTGCIAGALADDEFLAMLDEAGFRDSSIEPVREYTDADAHGMLLAAGLDADALAPLVAGRVYSGFVRATRAPA